MPNNASIFLYSSAFAISCVGAAYSIVPLYKIICQKTGITGTPQFSHRLRRKNDAAADHYISIKFVSNRGKNSSWAFRPSQKSVNVKIGQTALAFYEATNQTNFDSIGLATYNIVPSRAAMYFNKIQCFCFEEQRLGPGEHIEMPIYFYIDPDFEKDPLLKNTREIILSYSVFDSKNEQNE